MPSADARPGDWRSAVESCSAALIIVASPNRAHRDQVTAALAADAAVRCETPAGRSAAESAAMAALPHAEVRVYCSFAYRHALR